MAEFGKRLLPEVVDHYARTTPGRVYASIPRSTTDLDHGFLDVTMSKLAAVVNHLSYWVKDAIGVGTLDAIAYLGPPDIRYAAIFLAGVKCGYKESNSLFIESNIPLCSSQICITFTNMDSIGPVHFAKKHDVAEQEHA